MYGVPSATMNSDPNSSIVHPPPETSRGLIYATSNRRPATHDQDPRPELNRKTSQRKQNINKETLLLLLMLSLPPPLQLPLPIPLRPPLQLLLPLPNHGRYLNVTALQNVTATVTVTAIVAATVTAIAT